MPAKKQNHISEKLKMESSVCETLYTILDTSPFCVGIWDARFNLIFCNNRVLNLFGVSSKEEFYECFDTFVPEYQLCGALSKEKIPFFLTQAFSEGFAQFEWMHQTINQEPLPTEVTLVRFTQEDEDVVVAYINDLRPAKMAAEIVHEREVNNRIRLMLDAAPVTVTIYDVHSRAMIDCNMEAVKMFEFTSKDEFIKEYNKRFFDFSAKYQPCGTPTPEKVNYVFEQMTYRDRFQLEWMHITNSGEEWPTEINFVSSTYNNKPVMMAYVRDLRQIKEVEKQRHDLEIKERETNEMNKIFLESSPFPIELWDEDYNVIDCNDQTLALFGFSDKDQYIKRFYELSPECQPCGTPSHQVVHSRINEAFQKGKTRFEYWHCMLNGELMPTDVTLIRIVRNGKKMLIGYSVDLRPLREAEDRIKLMLDATPLAISMYDKNSDTLTANLEAMRMFKLSKALEFSNVAAVTMPPFQPDGRGSKEMLDKFIKQASEEGHAYAKFISMRSDGTLFPSEATWVRIKYKDSFVVIEYLRDLTIEKEAHEREQEADELTHLIMERAPLCIEMWDDKGDLVYCNQKMLDISGVETFEEYKARFYEFSGERQPDGASSSERLTQLLNEALQDGFVRFEWTHLTASGEPIPYESQFLRIVRQGQNMILGYSHDVRKIKNAMAKLYEADERAAVMMGAAPISCFMIRQVISEDGKTEFDAVGFNQASLDLFGFSDSVEATKRFYDIFPTPSEDVTVAEVILDNAAEALESGYSQFEFTHQRLDGTPIPCEVTLVRIAYKGDMTLICFQSDLRLVRAVIENERNAHRLTQMFLDAAPFFIEIWDKDLNLIECNKSAVEMFGLTDEDEYIKIFNDLSPEYQPCGTLSAVKIQKLIETCFREGSSRTEWMHIDTDGNLLPVDVIYIRLKRGDDYIAVGYNQDLRQIKAALEKEREAEAESLAKTQFLTRMSHEIRTPMNSIMGIAEIELQKSVHPPVTEEAFQRIYNSSRLLLSIINDILDLSKVEAGKMEIIPAVYETASFIADVLQLNLMYIGSKRIDFKVSADENLPLYLIGDELRIKQILNNILSNAFKYTDEGVISLTFEFEKACGDRSMNLVISVTDTGQGMSEEQLKSLFSVEFTRFNQAQNRAVEGSGLGMVITHSLVEMMNGEITVKSEMGKGSTFTVCIPQKPEGEQILGKETVASLQNLEAAKAYLDKITSRIYEPMPYGRVLVVDDVESNLYVAKGILLPYKLSVETMSSGRDAINRIEEGHMYDIIFMDHMMPGMDGVEAIKILHGLGYSHPIVALTANATFGASQLFIENGFSDFISKPVDPNKMEACLMKFIFDKQSPEAIANARALYPGSRKKDSSAISGKLIQSFLIDAENSISILEPIMQMRELDSNTFKTYTIQTHAMKSALHNVGRIELSKIAGLLEEAGRSEDIDVIKNETKQFLDSVREIVCTFSKAKEEDGPDIVEDSADIIVQLTAISVSCEAYNLAEIKRIIGILRQNPLSKKTERLLNEIEKCLLFSDYDDAALLAKQAVEEMQAG